MFGRIKKIAAKVIALNQDEMLDEILSDSTVQAQIIDLNQKQLYEQGVQADGSPTGSYSLNTMRRKQAYGDSWNTPGESSHITGNDTGITYNSMNVKVQPEGIVINADDRNGFFLRETKGLGLTNESKGELIKDVKLRLREKVREKIFA